MKRLSVSIILLLMITGICCYGIVLQQQYTHSFIKALKEMETAYVAENKEACKQLSRNFSTSVDKKIRVLSMFLPHDELTDIHEIAVMLPVILEQKEDSHFLSELEQCRLLIKRTMNASYPLVENIL